MKQDYINEIKRIYEKSIASYPDEDVQKFSGYFFIILTLATVIFFGIFAIAPTLNTVSNLNKQYKDNMVVYQALSQKLANLTLLDSQYQTVKNDEPLIYAAIPQNSDIPKLTRQIENLVTQDNLNLKTLTFGSIEIYPNIKNDSIYSFTFVVSVAGAESDVNKFTSDIINIDRIIGIERISTGTDQNKQFSLSFTGRAFFAPK